jgi:hypothetical protein
MLLSSQLVFFHYFPLLSQEAGEGVGPTASEQGEMWREMGNKYNNTFIK